MQFNIVYNCFCMYLYYIVQAALFWRFSCTRRYPSPYSYQWSVTSLLWSISTLVLSISVWPWPRRETPRTWPCITTGAGSPRRTSKEWPLSWQGTWFIESCLRFLIEGVARCVTLIMSLYLTGWSHTTV